MTKKIKAINIILALVFLASSAGLLWVVNNLDPKAAKTNPVIFFVTSFLVVYSLTFFIGFNIRQRFGLREHVSSYFKVSARQAIWYGLTAVSILVMQSYRMLNLTNSVMLAAAIICLELFFIFNDRKTANN